MLYIDTGGTFTDCIAVTTDGNRKRLKVLSNSTLRGTVISWLSAKKLRISQNWDLESDFLKGFRFRFLRGNMRPVPIHGFNPKQGILSLAEEPPPLYHGSSISFEITSGEEAPILAARILTQTPLGSRLPQIHMKLGFTKGTNALLEKSGSPTVLLVTKGFKDVLNIGNQQRPQLFARNPQKPAPVPERCVEVSERIDSQGKVIEPIDTQPLKELIEQLRDEGYRTAAVSFVNAYRNGSHEQQCKRILQKAGFQYVTASTDLSKRIKYLERSETTAVNAYLAPIIHSYLANIHEKMRDGLLHVMSSAGGLIRSEDFHSKDCLLSGPAGGVVGATQKALLSGFQSVITFDMGGTSTDVSRYDGQYEYHFDLNIRDVHIFTPTIAIETVAAGGGSVCYFDGFKLSVGPESAGANPGPACYGADGPLSITDINLLAGRMDTESFGIPVSQAAAEEKLDTLIEEIYQITGERRDRATIINGFLQIADEIMAGAIKKISVSKGYAPSQYALVGFGGAGGLHTCSIAELLGIGTILVPSDAGVLSAYGLSRALIERFSEKQILLPLEETKEQLGGWFQELERTSINSVLSEGLRREEIVIRHKNMYLRFRGQDSSIEISYDGESDTCLETFRKEYIQRYGYWPEGKTIEVESIRVIASVKERSDRELSVAPERYRPEISQYQNALLGKERVQIPVYYRNGLHAGAHITGPAIIPDRHSTTYLAQDWTLLIDNHETMVLRKKEQTSRADRDKQRDALKAEETELELFTNRFTFIAENMGAMLQRTSLSVNVKERVDFSCALLDADGDLVANAHHIPVHLGSLGMCVKELKHFISMEKGDVVITNHPKFGGSHLPDITLISPVYIDDTTLVGYLVNRAHHAEIGGIAPASMPSNARSLWEEGVILGPMYLVKHDRPQWETVRSRLLEAPYPTRRIAENLADLHAALAANRNGQAALLELIENQTHWKVSHYMQLLKQHAADKMRQTLRKIDNGIYTARESLDDGTPLRVKVAVQDESCTIDFTGSGDVHPGNLNATKAIVNSVVIYVLRVLIDEPIPLNDGIVEPVELIVPRGLLNPDFPEDPQQCPAIVGGNVEVSQRLTDTVLKAFGILACSQGTMNNVMFGNENYSYYETICGGCGAGAHFHGASALHSHMTNTRITDPEVLEHRYPVRLERFEIRKNSGGGGRYHGGEGVIRELHFRETADLSLLSQHRKEKPYGLYGGEAGKPGEQWIERNDGRKEVLDGTDGCRVDRGDRVIIYTPGGGGFG